METRPLPLTVTLEKNEALLLTPSDAPAPEVTEKTRLRLRFDKAAADFGNNFLTMDTLRWSEDGEHFSAPMLCGELTQLLLKRRYDGKLWLRYEFEIEKKPEKMLLLMEKAEGVHRVNGKVISFDRSLPEEPCVLIADISPFLREGDNRFETELHWHQSEDTYYALFGEDVTENMLHCIVYDSEIEAVYLAGHFGVRSHANFAPYDGEYLLGHSFYITSVPETVSEPVTDGLPFFRGDLTLTQKVKLTETDLLLELPGDYLTAKVYVNDQYAGEFCYNGTLDISKFTVLGENTFRVTFTIGNRNLLGPFHAQLDESFVAPELFEACDLPAGPNGEPRYKFHCFY